MQKEIVVSINQVDSLTKFANIAGRYENLNIKACREPWVVNCASILGLLSLDISKPLTVKVEGSEKEENDIDAFINEVKDNIK